MLPFFMATGRDGHRQTILRDQAQALGIDCINSLPTQGYFLCDTGQILQLCDAATGLTIAADFTTPNLLYRISHNRGEMLLRALDWRHNQQIWDATAGLGQDAFIAAAFGAQVHLFEHHPVVFLLLYDGLYRAATDARTEIIAARMCLTFGSISTTNIVTCTDFLPDVIYLDPMFAARQKSAAVNKNMQIFQKILHNDTTAANETALLHAACQYARNRIVVKRGKQDPPLAGITPDYDYRGKSTRFDVYQPEALSRRLVPKKSP